MGQGMGMSQGQASPPAGVDLAGACRPLVLALDVGSSSARAGLLDAAGRHLSGTLTDIAYRMTTTPDGGAELDPDDLLHAVIGTIDGALTAAGSQASEIRAVGISTFWHSLMGIDESGRALTPVYTWADTRAAKAAEQLSRQLDAEAYHRRTGAILHPSYPLAKLAWLRRDQPNRFKRVSRWLSFGEFLQGALFGPDRITCSISMASGTGLFDQTRQTWDAEALAAAGIGPDQLSPLGDAPLFGLLPEYAKHWPALTEAAWFPALGDGACSNLGSGSIGPDRVAVMVGTTGAMRLLRQGEPVAPPPGLWLYRLDSEHILLGGALSEGGNLFDWLRAQLQLPGLHALGPQLAVLPPDGHGLTWLPFLAGERSPDWALDARATLTGITLDTTALEIMRAGLEAVAYRFALIAERLQAALPGERTIVASGNGLLRNPVWMQILADVLGRPVVASPEPEASLKGAALMALRRLDERSPSLLEPPPLDGATRFDPIPANAPVYQAAIARQQALYARMMRRE